MPCESVASEGDDSVLVKDVDVRSNGIIEIGSAFPVHAMLCPGVENLFKIPKICRIFIACY